MSTCDLLPYSVTLLVRDACLCLHAQRAARGLARRYDAALRPVGLTNGQFSLMMSLNRPEPPCMAEVAALLGMDRTTLTAMLKALERRRLVKVTTDAADRRNRRMVLTAAGRAKLAAAMAAWAGAQQETAVLLGGTDPEQVRAALRALG